MSGLSRAYKRRPKGLPLSIPGLQLWLDASDASTLFTDSAGTTAATADGDPVGCWKDKSGNNINLVQSDGTAKPALKLSIQASRNIIRFDGTNDRLTGSLSPQSSNRTTFLVAKRTSTSSDWRGAVLLNAIDDSDVTGTTMYTIQQAGNGANQMSGGRPAEGLGYEYTGSGILCFVISQTNSLTASATRLNGSAVGSLSYGSQPIGSGVQIRVGAGRIIGSEVWYGDIAEIAIYDSVLSAGNIASVESYLNAKWSVY